MAQLKQEFETQLAAQRASWEEERRALQAQIAQGDRRSSSSVAPTPKVVITKPKVCVRETEHERGAGTDPTRPRRDGGATAEGVHVLIPSALLCCTQI